MEKLIETLKSSGVLTSKSIESALRETDRARFTPEEMRVHAYDDRPLPIGFEQTISQPSTVVFMLELLEAQPGQRILDIGAGSGWQTALLAHIVGTKGHVTGIERIPELHALATQNVEALGLISDGSVDMILGSAVHGYLPSAPYDRIICAASIDRIPEEWIDQLAEDGSIVSSVAESILHVHKTGSSIKRSEYPGFLFVPFVAE